MASASLVDNRCSDVQAGDLSERFLLDNQQEVRGRSFADDFAAFRSFHFEPVGLVPFVANEREPVGFHFDRLVAAAEVNSKGLHARKVSKRTVGGELKYSPYSRLALIGGRTAGEMEQLKVYAALVIMAAFFSTIMTLLFKVRDRVLVWQKGVIKW